MMTNDPRALANLSTVDYDAIELAVMETARGRWFLKEFAARNRQADTTVLLDAMARLESAVSGERAMEHIERVRFDLVEMATSISGLKAELEIQEDGDHPPGRFGAATSALDGIVRTTEQATSNILGATEQIQEIAWSLREQQFDPVTCDTIDKLATEIYTACGFQDLTAQRTQKVVRTLRFLEGRINALIDAWAAKSTGDAADQPRRDQQPVSIENKPDPSGDGRVHLVPFDLSQSDIDFVIVEDPFGTGVQANLDAQGASEIPANVLSALTMAEASTDLNQMVGELRQVPVAPEAGFGSGSEPGEELMAGDEDPIFIDDLDTLDLDFVRLDEDVVPDKTAKPPVSHTVHQSGTSLASLDALPTTAKALIFG
jgi:chemotaxis regulatin CheY-phosphate phosphatase CheZ